MKYIDRIPELISKLEILNYNINLRKSDRETFNIFKALHHEKDEVRLHSRFISVLLSPNSNHKKNNLFLKLFIDEVNMEGFELDNNIEVYPNEFLKSEYKNIDILIINRLNKKAIIIENKIYAGDSNNKYGGQLERYHKLLIEEEDIPEQNISVIYLSVDGRNPSDESFGSDEKLKKKTILLDYEHNIKSWLNKCIQNCINEPFLRESINQYTNLINNMTNNIDISDRLEIKDLISKSENDLRAAKLLFDNFKHIKWHTAMEFWCKLKTELKSHKYTIIQEPSEDNITNTTHYVYYKNSYEKLNDYGLKFSKSGYSYFIWNSIKGIYWGMLLNDNLQKEEVNDKYFKNSIDNNYLWKYFDLDEGKYVNFTNFHDFATFSLVKKENRDNLIGELIKEVNYITLK